jgi:hypothetical protein
MEKWLVLFDFVVPLLSNLLSLFAYLEKCRSYLFVVVKVQRAECVVDLLIAEAFGVLMGLNFVIASFVVEIATSRLIASWSF